VKIAIGRYRSEVVFKTVLLLLTAATFLVPAYSPAQSGQKTFESPQQAVDALLAANKDNNVAALNQILGPDASTLISSGDDTQDNKDRAHFVDMYEERHRLVPTGTGRQTLVVGKSEWALPIPLIKSDGAWKFDSAEGVKELLYRRIGSNELAAIKVCQALRQAQLDYAATGHDGIDPGILCAAISKRAQ